MALVPPMALMLIVSPSAAFIGCFYFNRVTTVSCHNARAESVNSNSVRVGGYKGLDPGKQNYKYGSLILLLIASVKV